MHTPVTQQCRCAGCATRKGAAVGPRQVQEAHSRAGRIPRAAWHAAARSHYAAGPCSCHIHSCLQVRGLLCVTTAVAKKSGPNMSKILHLKRLKLFLAGSDQVTRLGALLHTSSMAASQPPLRARAPAQPGPVTQLDQQTASQVPATGFSAHQRQEISYQAAKSETRAAPRLTHPRTDVPASHAHKRCETPRCAFFTATLLGHSHLNGRPIQLLARDAYKTEPFSRQALNNSRRRSCFRYGA